MASSSTQFKLVDVSRVGLLFDSDDAHFSLPLSFYDLMCLRVTPAKMLYMYEMPNLTTHHFTSLIFPKLKKSLSHTLFHYLPIAGNLTWPLDSPKPHIQFSYRSNGIQLTLVESHANFDALSRNKIHQNRAFHHLSPELEATDDRSSIISIQITVFPRKGYSIGITLHHMVLDGQSLDMFLKSWVDLTKKENSSDPSLSPELVPIFDRSIIKDPMGLEAVYLEFWARASQALNPKYSNPRSLKTLELPSHKSAVEDAVRGSFEMSFEDIINLKKRAASMMTTKSLKPLHFSSFAVILAHVTICIVRAVSSSTRKVYLLFPVDHKPYLKLPSNYFGNTVGFCKIVEESKVFMEENALGVVAKKISEGIKMTMKAPYEELKKGLETEDQVGAQTISVAGSPWLPTTPLDFGMGSLKKVNVQSIDKLGAVFIARSFREKGGVKIGVVLSPDEMDRFVSFDSYLKMTPSNL